MIELFRQYWWVAMLIAIVIVVVTHAGLVKLIAMLQEQDRAAMAARDRAGGKDGAGDGNPPPAG